MDDYSSSSRTPSAPELRFGKIDDLSSRAASAIDAARNWLLSQQHEEGYWCGELEADSMLEADYIFLHALLESGDPERLQRAFTEMMRYQKEDGSWAGDKRWMEDNSVLVTSYAVLALQEAQADLKEHPAK